MKIEIKGMNTLSEYAKQQNAKYAEQLAKEEISKEEYDSSVNERHEAKIEIEDGAKGKVIFTIGYSDAVEIDIDELKRALKIF